MEVSKREFEERMHLAPKYIRDIYDNYEALFSEDLISIYWYPGWTHIVESFLRTIEKDEKTQIVKIKSHWSHLYVHYYTSGNNYAVTLDYINYYCSVSCRQCGDLIKLGDIRCEQCR